MRTKSHEMARNSAEPMTKPSAGEMKMNATVFRMPAGMSAQIPALATPAPTRPPISACDDDEGMPYHQVMMFQEMAPTSAPSTTLWSTMPVSMMPLPTVAA